MKYKYFKEAISSYGFRVTRNGTVKKCKCRKQLYLCFSDKESEYHYECDKDEGGCGWLSDINRNYESEYAKELGLYKKRIKNL